MALETPLVKTTGEAYPREAATGDTLQVPADLQVDGVIHGPSDGTGVVVGQAPSGASTGSTLQILSVTTTERDNLVVANGMVVYNTTAGEFQFYEAGAWRTFGAGGGGGGGTVLLATTSTAADINAAWTSSVHTVFLTPGTFDENGGGGMTTQVTVPAGKALAGSAMGALEDTLQTGHVRMEWSGNPTGGALTLEEGASVRGVHVIKTGTLATEPGIAAEIGPTVYSSYEVIDCHCTNWAVGFEFPLGATGSGTTGLRLRGCVADACTVGFEVRYSVNAADERVMIEMTHCIGRDCTSTGFLLQMNVQVAAQADLYANVTYCSAIDNGGDGFNFANSGSSGFAAARGHLYVAFNYSEGNSGDGFDITAAAGPTFVFNRAIDNTLFGFDVPSAGGSITTTNKRGVFFGNEAFGNGSGDIEYTSGSNETWTGRWANFSGVQHGAGVVCVESGSIANNELQDLLDMNEVHTVVMTDQGTSGDAVVALGATSLNIPDNKRLIGSSRALADITSVPFAGQVRFTYTGTGTAIVLNDGAHVQGVQVDQAGTDGTGIAFSLNGVCGTIEGCYADDFATGFQVSTTAIYLTQITHCKARDCTTGFLQNASVATEQKCVIEYCVAENGTTGFDIDGSTSGFVQVVGCTATNCSGDGFNQRGAWGGTAVSSVGYVHVRGCHAENCGGEGFDLDNFGHGRTMVTDCRASNCTGNGFACALGDADEELRPYIGNCVAAANGTTQFSIDGTWARGPFHFTESTAGTANAVCDSTEQCLAVYGNVNLKTVASNTLLTAGTSAYLVITKVVVYIRSFNATSPHTVDPIANVQTLSAGDIIASTTLALGISGSVNQYSIIQPARDGSAIQKVQPGNNLVFDVTTGADGTTLTADIQVWGYVNPFV